MQKTHYQLLNIEITSTELEVKKAYFQLIKQYPLEKNPEVFQEIRVAYETLKDPQSRKEYDLMVVYGREIEDLKKSGIVAFEDDDFNVAGKIFKKILLIEPDLREIRNYFALCHLYSGRLDKAVQQFKKLVIAEPENQTYLMNCGIALKESGQIEEAMRHYKRMVVLDPSNMKALFALIDLYVDLKNEEIALKTLDQSVKREWQNSSHVFYYIVKRLNTTLIFENREQFSSSMAKIEEYLIERPEEKGNVLSQLSELGLELYDQKRYSWALELFQFSYKNQSDNEKFVSLIEETKKKAKLYDDFDRLQKEEKISIWVKNILFIYLYGDDLSEEEFDTKNKKVFNDLKIAAVYNPEVTLASIKRVNIKYPELYEVRKEVLENYFSICSVSLEQEEQYERLKEDQYMCYSIVRLVAYYLTYFESDDEKKKAFDDILNGLTDEPSYERKKSANRLEDVYPALFNLNEDFFRELQS